MKELALVIGMITVMYLAYRYFEWEVTIYSLLWQMFATLFALAWQDKSYKNK